VHPKKEEKMLGKVGRVGRLVLQNETCDELYFLKIVNFHFITSAMADIFWSSSSEA